MEFWYTFFNYIQPAAASVSDAFQKSPTFAIEVFIYATLGGLLPALIWLWFWMHENHDHHEPKNTLWLTFLAGMSTVFVVYPFQKLASFLLGEVEPGFNTLFAWAALEEVVKYLAAFFIALRLKYTVFDEPIDAFVYLMTAALGFSAMENTLFLLGPLLQGETLVTVVTGNMRFMGANLLHVAASGVLSLCIAFSYFKPVWLQRVYLVGGLLLATSIHSIFNILLVVVATYNDQMIFVAFSYVWITLIILILALEKVKQIKEF